jgi:hypothetical protein
VAEGLLPISATQNVGLDSLLHRLDKNIQELTNRRQHVFRQESPVIVRELNSSDQITFK